MKHLRTIVFAVAWLCLAVAPGSAQNSQGGTRIIALPGGSGVSSSIVSGTTPITGTCAIGSNLYNNGGVVGCQATSLVIGATPITGGATTQVLFNNGGVVGSDAGLTKAAGATGAVAIGGLLTVANGTNATGGSGLQFASGVGFLGISNASFDVQVGNGTTLTHSFSRNLTGDISIIESGCFFWAASMTSSHIAPDTGLCRQGAGIVELTTSDIPNASASLLLAGLTASGSITATGLPTSTPGGTPSTVCWDATAQTLWTDASATGPCGIVSALRFKNLIDDNSQFNLAGLANLRTGPWQFKPDSPYGWDTKIHVGLIADQVAAMDPRCGTYDKNGDPKDYEDRCVIAYLVGALQAMRVELQALRGK